MRDTSWGQEAVVGEYQKNLILPNLLRLLDIKRGETVLDLGCGPGFFAREFWRAGAKVIGVDISKKLVEDARKTSPKEIEYCAGSAENLSFLKNKSIDKIAAILALQNMDNLDRVFKECARILKPNGGLFMVINHPAFRVPKESSWGWDDEKKTQYRRVDRYLSESKVKIQMHPSTLRYNSGQASPADYTITFHRPLQIYLKLLNKIGFVVSRLEEWISPRKSQPGPRAKAENLARKEIPLFLFMEMIKIG